MEVWDDFEARGERPSDRDEWLVSLLRARRLPVATRLVGAVLGARMNDAGLAAGEDAPSLPHLADDANVDEPAAAGAVRLLEEEGWLLVDRRRGRRHCYQAVPAAVRAGTQMSA